MPIPTHSRLSWAIALAALVAAAASCRDGGEPRTVGIQARVPRDTGWAELDPRGRIDQVDVGPDGRLWMGSMQGEIFSADSIDGAWKLVLGPPPEKPDSFGVGVFLPGFDRVTWVGSRTAIASGYIGRGESERKDVVMRTTDGGMRWDSVSFGEDQWVYNAFVDRRGGVWMGGSSGALVFSGDSGRTWRTVAHPYDEGDRLEAIWIDDGRTGVAAALGNALKLTRDGGRTWRKLPTPLDQKAYRPEDTEYNHHRFTGVALLGGTLWAVQEGHLFTTPLARVQWAEVAAGEGEALYTFTVDRASGTLYALGTSRRVYEIGVDRVPRPLSATPLYAFAASLAVRGGAVYTVDEQGGLYRISRGGVAYARALTRGPPPTVRWLAPAAANLTWGASGHALYATADGGRSWRLAGTSPQEIAGVRALEGGRVMLWSGHGFNAVFDPRSGRLDEIADLHGDDVVGLVANDSLWVAYGGAQTESAGRVDVARTFYPGEFAGTRPSGFVYVSRDRGGTWRRIDTWRGHGVLGVFVHPDGGMTLLSYLGSVRRLTRTAGGGYRAHGLVTAAPRNRETVPYVQQLGAMYFNGREGWIDGWVHHLGNRRHVTHDGGRTWARAPARGYQALFPLRSGWVGATGHRVLWISGGTERELFRGGGQEAGDWEGDVPVILDVAPAPDGGVWVLLRSGEIRRIALPR